MAWKANGIQGFHLVQLHSKLVQKMEDWYSITIADIIENGGKGVLRYFSSYKDAVMAAFNGANSLPLT